MNQDKRKFIFWKGDEDECNDLPEGTENPVPQQVARHPDPPSSITEEKFMFGNSMPNVNPIELLTLTFLPGRAWAYGKAKTTRL